MRKFLSACLIMVMIMSAVAVGAIAAPEAIKKETINLKADTIIVWKCKNGSYDIEYIDSGAGNTNDCTKIIPSNHSSKLGGYAILKVDISSVKSAAEFNLKFSFDTGDNINNGVTVYCADYSEGEDLIADLIQGGIKNVTVCPDICSAYSDKLIYEFNKNASSVEKITAEVNSPVLKNHISGAVNRGEDSVYFLIRGVATSSGTTSDGSYFQLYNSASADKAPILTVTGSAVSSEVNESETGYTVKVAGLENYTDNALVVVTTFDSEDSLVKIAAGGQNAVMDGTVEVDIPCKNAAELKLYIWKAGTLEPITYPETIVLE